MSVRAITREEAAEARRLQSIAFNAGRNIEAEKPETLEHGFENVRASYDAKGRMTACFDAIPYTINYDGKPAGMAGIGGVASLPENRMSGHIRAIFKEAFREMRERDILFSMLFPFSHTYYRQFGYEVAHRVTIAELPINPYNVLAGCKRFGEYGVYNKGDDKGGIKDCYARFIAGKNLAVMRHDKLWDEWLDIDSCARQQYTYTWSRDGKVAGFFTYNVDRPAGRASVANIRAIAYDDGEALRALFGLMNSLRAAFGSIRLPVPPGIELSLMLPEPSRVSQTLENHIMVRTVDIGRVLGLMGTPEGSGRAAIVVNDGFIDENTGAYTLEWENGGSTVKKEKSPPSTLPCIELDEKAFATLAVGFVGLREARQALDVRITGDAAVFERLFPRKDIMHYDYY